MKKILFTPIFFILILINQNTHAQSLDVTDDLKPITMLSKPKPVYLNFSYGSQKLEFDNDKSYFLKSDYAAAITIGRTFYMHKKPIANIIRIGLDWTFFDLNFAGYSETPEPEEYENYYDDDKLKTYQAEAAMHVGPSITISPVQGLNISAYLRYAPSFSGIYSDEMDQFSGTYASFFVAGLSVSYKFISLGVENRWGSAKYKFDDDSDEENVVSRKLKMNTSGPRFYLGFRF